MDCHGHFPVSYLNFDNKNNLKYPEPMQITMDCLRRPASCRAILELYYPELNMNCSQ
jgi:hypothetical protein